MILQIYNQNFSSLFVCRDTVNRFIRSLSHLNDWCLTSLKSDSGYKGDGTTDCEEVMDAQNGRGDESCEKADEQLDEYK